MATQASDTANSTANKRARGASSDELAVVAQRAQAFTNASGVAIALSEGNANEIVCRARSGASAPDVGAALRVEGTFTGLCIQTGKELRCDDCETDTRVDMTAIRALGIRSMVVTPIREDNRVIGVVAVFAPTPHAFTITHVAVLKTMADQISTLLQKRSMVDDSQSAESTPAASPAIVAKPVQQSATPAAAAPVVIKPSPTLVRNTPTATAKVEPIRSMPVEVVPLAVPPTKREERQVESPRANFGTFDAVAGEQKKSGGRSMAIGVIAVLVVAAAGTFTFLKWQKPGAPSAPQHTQEAANVPAIQPSASTGSEAQPGVPNNASASQPTATIAANSPVPTIKASENDGKKNAKNNTDKSSSTSDKTPAEKQTAVTTFAASGPSRINAQRNSDQSQPEIAPSFATGGNTSGSISALARPAGTVVPSAAAIEQSQLEPLQLIKTVPLPYPAIAKARRISGPVVVEVKVGKDGSVSNPKFISGQPIFKDSAFEAVLQYKFRPAKLNGQPIEQTTQVRLNFSQQ